MEEAVFLVATLCNLKHALGGNLTAHQTEDTVRQCADGGGRLDSNVLFHADIDVTVGADELVVAAGGDVFIGSHGVGEGSLSTTRPNKVERGGEQRGGVIVCSHHTAASHGCSNDTCEGVHLGADAESERESGFPRHVHLVGVFQCGALADLG